jgi:hypothetical protein
MTAAIATTPADLAALLAELTPGHALSTAEHYPYATGVTFTSALAEARCYERPWVLQKRHAEHGHVEAAVCVTRWTRSPAEGQSDTEVILWIPRGNDDPRAGSWQDTPIGVTASTMAGMWTAVSHASVLNAEAGIKAAARAADDSRWIPRTAEAAISRARILRLYGEARPAGALECLAAWLPGGDMMTRGHELAARINLCGEYEAAVVPTLGWTPRRGEQNSRMVLAAMWHDAMDAVEAEATDARDAVVRALVRVECDGVVNRAIVEHAENHLEREKRPAVNELLAELGMSPIGGMTRTWEVELRVERTRTVTEYTTVTVEVEATDEDDAHDEAHQVYSDHMDYCRWIVEDDCYETEETDVTVEDVTEL